MRDLFRLLYEEAHTLAKDVFERGDLSHPCAYLLRDAYTDVPPAGWPSNWRQVWHLPETFSGDPALRPPVAFVGLNPSIKATECCPRFGASFDEWWRFYSSFIGPRGHLSGQTGQRQPPPLYAFYSRTVRAVLGDEADLPTHALVTDVIHYKAQKPGAEETLDKAIKHSTSLPLTLELLRRSGCRVVVLVGEKAYKTIGPRLGVPESETLSMTEANGRCFQAGGFAVVPSFHTSKWPTTEQRRAVANGVAEGLGLAPPFEGMPLEVYRERRKRIRPSVAPRRAHAADDLREDDILEALRTFGLVVTREGKGWRGADGRVGGRYVYWPRTVKGRIRCLHLGRFTVTTPFTQPINNGNVKSQLVFQNGTRAEYGESLNVAIRLLVDLA